MTNRHSKIYTARRALLVAFTGVLRFEQRSKKNRATARQHLIDGLLHLPLHFTANRFHHGAVICGLRRGGGLHVYGSQEASVPLRWQWYGQERKSWGHWNAGPLRITIPHLRLNFRQNRKD